MRIKRLDIVGFKSFMDRTTIVFDDGVTGVVGPNGCGKSNVADSIRWVLGEQSARQLRGRSMEDVIFNGSETKPPLSMAEVMLTFVNDRPSELPPAFQGFGEITVGRRLFRSGESEYVINGVAARLLDVNDIFFGSGVGRTAYSIIEQGRIGQIVSARPEDRRAIIEEAAGITKYKKRREAAERRMEATQQNLTRVADIVQELGKQLESLNRQARSAETYKAIREEIRELELRAAAARYLELTATRRAAEERHAELQREAGELAARIAELEAATETDRVRLTDGEGRLHELTAKEHELESAARVNEVSVEAAARELEQIAERTRAQAAEVEALKEQAEALSRERDSLERQREELQGLAGADDGRLSEAEAALRALAIEQGQVQSELDRIRGEGSGALSRAATAKTQLAQIERQRIDLKSRHQRNRAEADDLSHRASTLDGSRTQHVEKLGQTRQLKLRLEEQRGAQEELLDRTRSEFIQNEAKLITLREELAEKRSRLQSLLEIVRNYEGYGRGVRSLMTRAGQAEARDRGIFGLVADVVGAPPEYETAVEAVLGERLQYIIVESHSQGAEAIDYLKSAAEGRASLIPMARLRDAQAAEGAAPAPDRSHPGFVAACLDVVTFDPSYEKVARFLLGDAMIVRDLPSALEIWQSSAQKQTLVTLDGEVLDPWGVVTGGPLEGEGHGALQRRREVQDLEQTVRGFEAQFALAQDRHHTLQARTAQLEAALRTLDRDGREKDLLLIDQEKDLARFGADLEVVAGRAAELEAERAELEGALEALAREEGAERLEAAAAEAEQSRVEERSRELVGRLDDLKARGEQLAGELLTLKVKVAADAERREAIGSSLRRVEDSRREVDERRARIFSTLSEQNARAGELRGRVEGSRLDLGRLEAELAQVREALAAARAAHEQAAVANRSREAEIREIRRLGEEAAHASSEAALTGREQALALSHLEEQTRERCQVELKLEISRFHLERPPGDAERERLDELKGQAERMGAINLTAIEEYDDLARRHAF